jgi:hypothetical protein
MPRTSVALLIFLLLVLSVPWWWIGADTSEEAGLPPWAVYAIVANVVFAISVAWMLKRFWHRFEERDTPPPEEK